MKIAVSSAGDNGRGGIGYAERRFEDDRGRTGTNQKAH